MAWLWSTLDFIGLCRSAQALITPLSAGALEFDQAIQRLKRAYSIDATNKDTSRLLKELQQQKRRQQITDHETFGGMFDRGQLYREEELQKPQEKDGGSNVKDNFEVQVSAIARMRTGWPSTWSC